MASRGREPGGGVKASGIQVGDRLLLLSIYTLMHIVWRAAWDTAVLPIDEVVQQTSGEASKVQNGVKSAT